MNDRRDAFDDVEELRNATFGSLAGEGADFLEKVKTELSQEGINSTCSCGQCNRPNVITVGWDEAIIGSLKLMPPGWLPDPKTGSIFPNVGCAGCGYRLPLLFTPRELKGYVDRGIAAGDVNKQWANTFASQVAGQAQAQAQTGMARR